MFIDGTCIRISRPSAGEPNVFYDLQRLFYSGYKKFHNINFSVIVSPDGLVIDVCGPVPGRHSDKWVQSWSSVQRRLRELFHNTNFKVFGDAIYSDSDVIRRKKRGLNLNQQDLREIHNLNGGRVCVENVFGEVVNDFKFIDLKRNFKVLGSKCGIGNLYKVGLLLHNFRCCCRGSQSGDGLFGLSPPDLVTYINGGVNCDSRLPNIVSL